jgi:5-hydroxyisourate hydrolase-like protein (transthyretin family)
MAYTTGTTSFNLDLNDLIEEAYERAGIEVRTGYEFRTARRSLNLLTIEWANRGINLWTIQEGAIAMVTGQAIYPLPADTIDLLDHVIRQNNGTPSTQSDINITRISESTYSTIPNKLTNGRPIQVWVNRQSAQTNATSVTLSSTITSTDTTITLSDVSDLTTTGFIKIDSETIGYTNVSGNSLINCLRGQNGTTAAAHTAGAAIYVQNLPCINVWPTPDAGGNYTFVYWRLRRLQDAGNGVNVEDIPFRLIPCMVAGLAFYIAAKRADADPTRVSFLKDEYEQQWLLASQEDREKASDRFVPRVLFY